MAEQLTVPNDAVDTQAEEEHNQAMLEKIGEVDPQTIESDEDLDGTAKDKFDGDYDKLKSSYDELEKKLGQGKEDEPAPDDEGLEIPESVEGVVDMEGLTAEYSQNGELSEKSYKSLEKAGISNDIVDSYIRGQEALGAQIGNTVKESVGGEKEYSAMVEWARVNMSEGELKTYNSAVNSGDINMAKMAAKGLKSDYTNSEGSAGDTYGGKSNGSFESRDVFRSNAELTTAMKDTRYETDHAYRADVMKKLERSDMFKQNRL